MKILHGILAIAFVIAMVVWEFKGNISKEIFNGVLAIWCLIEYEVSE